jgi:hypothetical protein
MSPDRDCLALSEIQDLARLVEIEGDYPLSFTPPDKKPLF